MASGSAVPSSATRKLVLGGKKTASFYLLNPTEREVERIEVDGCAITEGKRCDWLVLLDDAISKEEIYVELKGSAVYHAVVWQKNGGGRSKKKTLFFVFFLFLGFFAPQEVEAEDFPPIRPLPKKSCQKTYGRFLGFCGFW
jgi:hypothetical protein